MGARLGNLNSLIHSLSRGVLVRFQEGTVKGRICVLHQQCRGTTRVEPSRALLFTTPDSKSALQARVKTLASFPKQVFLSESLGQEWGWQNFGSLQQKCKTPGYMK